MFWRHQKLEENIFWAKIWSRISWKISHWISIVDLVINILWNTQPIFSSKDMPASILIPNIFILPWAINKCSRFFLIEINNEYTHRPLFQRSFSVLSLLLYFLVRIYLYFNISESGKHGDRIVCIFNVT